MLSTSVSISVQPGSALVDDSVDIVVKNLKPKQKVTIASYSNDSNVKMVSNAYFEANDNGQVSCTNDESLGGTYKGKHADGLFWSQKNAINQRDGLRYLKKDITTPINVKLAVFDGHIDICDEKPFTSNSYLSVTQLDRWYLDQENVDRKEIAEGNIRGTLFMPKGKGPFKGIVDLFGTGGGLFEHRGALFSSRGFAVLCLGYFDYRDIPPNIDIPLDYFEEGVKFLESQEKVEKGGVGVIGLSLGAEIALMMVNYIPLVKAACIINGTAFLTFERKYKGRLVAEKTTDMDYDRIVNTEEGMVFKGVSQHYTPESVLPLNQTADCRIMVIAGEDDCNTDSVLSGHIVRDQIKKLNYNNFEMLSYPNTGHLIEPPHSPLCKVCYHKYVGTNLIYGGSTYEHAMAQIDSWRKMKNFFKKYVPNGNVPKSNY
ncbi:DgyrCDS4220 [Dimorphilus gyrociliatus]|uniref:DgyrCDS4220 n=1 Tax=Dimorphilus gyrociliatus TaxID=2664684 RepID=A0A7I8VHT0_9ANNE|nr:DgyrCDS4220 [Dimorphilus gyrociliatus]